MADITKKRFFEILDCVEDPTIDTRELAVFWRETVYCDVVLYYSNSFHDALQCMRIKGFAPKVTLDPSSPIILAGVRFSKYRDKYRDPDGDKRLEKKKAKYERWLTEYRARRGV
jgi:hypothetical protein